MTAAKYAVIAEALRLRCAQLPAGTRLPAETQLAREFRVSRMTIRQALDELAADRLISREPGHGTFVQRPPVQKGPTLTSFSEDMLTRGLRPSSRVIGFECRAADAEVAHDLQLRDGEKVLIMERLRMADGEPICLELAELPARFEELLRGQDLEQSLHAVLRNLGIELTSGTRTVRARTLAARDARLLHEHVGSPALEIVHLFRDSRGTPTQRARSLYRASRYEVVSEIERRTVPRRESLAPPGPDRHHRHAPQRRRRSGDQDRTHKS